MGTLLSSGTVTVIKARHGMEASIYGDEVEAIESMLNNGSLGGGMYHGCEEHVVALARVAKRIEEIRAEIEEQAVADAAQESEVDVED